MRVAVHIDTEVETDVSMDDVFAELNALPDGESLARMIAAVNIAYSVLHRVPAESIAEMNPKQRQLIAECLRRQADRYDESTDMS